MASVLEGQVIGMTADPSFRGFVDGLTVLMGTCFGAPAYAGNNWRLRIFCIRSSYCGYKPLPDARVFI